MWAKIKAWFYNSETILLARIQMFIAAAGSVAISFNWGQLVTGQPPTKGQYVLCAILFFQGLATEIVRRKGTAVSETGSLVAIKE